MSEVTLYGSAVQVQLSIEEQLLFMNVQGAERAEDAKRSQEPYRPCYG